MKAVPSFIPQSSRPFLFLVSFPDIYFHLMGACKHRLIETKKFEWPDLPRVLRFSFFNHSFCFMDYIPVGPPLEKQPDQFVSPSRRVGPPLLSIKWLPPQFHLFPPKRGTNTFQLPPIGKTPSVEESRKGGFFFFFWGFFASLLNWTSIFSTPLHHLLAVMTRGNLPTNVIEHFPKNVDR